MKKLYTLLIIIITISGINFVKGQEPVSLGLAPQREFQPFCNNPVDWAGSRAWYIDDDVLYKGSTGSCSLTYICSYFNGFIAAVFYNALGQNGTVYGNFQIGTFTLYRYDTTSGVRTPVFNLSGISFSNLTGMCWSPSNNTVYGCYTNLVQSGIFSVNMTNGVCTPIGSPTATCAGAISISAPKTGTSLFVIDIVNDNLYKFDRTNGACTLVGPLGVNANYGQDAQFDLSDNKLYWASYSTAPQLRILDTATGSSTVVCTFGITQMCGLAIKGQFVGINKDSREAEVNVYPNPAADIVNITAPKIEAIKVSNPAGQVLENILVNDNNSRIDVSKYDAGVYFVQVKTDKGLFTKKIIISR